MVVLPYLAPLKGSPNGVKKYLMRSLTCYDDSGLPEARDLSGISTIGIDEATFHAAMLLGTKFSAVTTLSVSIPIIDENLRFYGLDT